MEPKIFLPKNFCELEAIKYVASRYDTTPEEVLEHYFIQTGAVENPSKECPDYKLEPNEIALFHDLGIQPVAEEIK